MSELHKFLFDGMPVRGMLVRLTDAWSEILACRAGNTGTGPYPVPVRALLGEMAAAMLMKSNTAQRRAGLWIFVTGWLLGRPRCIRLEPARHRCRNAPWPMMRG